MQNVLIATESASARRDFLFKDMQADYRLGFVDPSQSTSDACDQLVSAFGGRPPAIVIADLRSSRDCLPLRRTRNLLQTTWFERGPLPICLGLLTAHHLTDPEWPAYVDDFALPPYDRTEIAARLKRLLFARRHVLTDDTLRIAGLVIDIAGRRATTEAGVVLALTPREFDLLAFFAQHRGKFYSRERLLDLVWGIDFDGGWRTVDIHVRRLRAKLPTAAGELIQTRRGSGYGLVTAPE
ncbi:MAG TPA: response regulator transcription factor [Capsulimonadaceae bacterium]|jgi:DNA-binding winged helix-turn-helix (wHTH) protein